MPTLDATVGGADANSYATRADADTYFDNRLNATGWSALSDDDKDRALITATSRIEQETFIGTPATETQALQWPRDGVVDRNGNDVPEDEIPQQVKNAQYEYALTLTGGTTQLLPSGLDQFTEVKVGSIQVKMKDGFIEGQLPDNVYRELEEFLSTSRNEIRKIRG